MRGGGEMVRGIPSGCEEMKMEGGGEMRIGWRGEGRYIGCIERKGDDNSDSTATRRGSFTDTKKILVLVYHPKGERRRRCLQTGAE